MLTNAEALRLIASQVQRVADPARGRDLAVMALLAVTADRPELRDAGLSVVRRLLAEHLPAADRAA
jgi:hypothetical protein